MFVCTADYFPLINRFWIFAFVSDEHLQESKQWKLKPQAEPCHMWYLCVYVYICCLLSELTAIFQEVIPRLIQCRLAHASLSSSIIPSYSEGFHFIPPNTSWPHAHSLVAATPENTNSLSFCLTVLGGPQFHLHSLSPNCPETLLVRTESSTQSSKEGWESG